MYINDGIPFSIVASGPAGLEIIFVSVLLSNNRGCLGTLHISQNIKSIRTNSQKM